MIKAPDWIVRRRLNTLKKDYLTSIALLGAVAIALFLGLGGAYGKSVIATILFYAMVTSGWCLLAGYGGMFSLAPSATVMISAYVSAIASNFGYSMTASILFGMSSGAVTGGVIALLTSRLKGHYFALATLVAAEIARLVVTNEYELTGGEAGLRTGPLVSGGSGMEMSILIGITLLVILTGLLYVLKGTWGIAIEAIHDDDEIASIRGINVPLTKTSLVVIGSLIMAFSGAVYVHYIQLATPQMGSVFQTTIILAIGIIGGMRSMSGPILGAALIIALQEVLRDYPFIHMGLTALSILLVCQFAPTGVAGFLIRNLTRFTKPMVSKERVA